LVISDAQWDNNSDKLIEFGSSSMLSCYTDEQKKIINYYKDISSDGIDKSKIYVFLAGKSSLPDVMGFNPISKQFGFLFLDEIKGGNTAFIHTLAHEISHGIFNLTHTFDYARMTTKGGTDNLMDYTSDYRTHLHHEQWDLIQNPTSMMFAWLQDDEEGAYVVELKIPELWWKTTNVLSPYEAGFIDGALEIINTSVSTFEYIILRIGGLGTIASGPANYGNTPSSYMGMYANMMDAPLREIIVHPNLLVEILPVLKKQIAEWVTENSNLSPEAQYKQGRLLFEVATLFIGVGEIKGMLKSGQSSVGLVKILKATNDDVGKVIFEAAENGFKFEAVEDGLKLLTSTGDEIAEIAGTALTRFDDDLTDVSFSTAIKENPLLATDWKALSDMDVDASVRKNIDALSDINATQDAIEVTGKAKPTWPEIQSYWKRGNDFNKKARNNQWYDYHEIHLKNGKRLDSYDPDLGEIVSRKATDFDNIQTTTFENYLKEFDNKYSPGTMIRSNKYPELDGKQLEGKKILEIPATNQTSSKLAEFQKLADDYHVELRFQSE
jgi:hypothetical protein